MIQFQAADVVEAVRQIASENPEHVFRELCLYRPIEDDAEGCIIGQAFDRLDPDWFDNFPPDLNDRSIARLFDDEIVVGSQRDCNWLQAVQFEQDARYPWAECVARADRAAA